MKDQDTTLGTRFPKTADELAALRLRGREDALDLAAFVDRSPTPYHATAEAARRLAAEGFVALDERAAWELAPGDKRYLVRGGSLFAFVVGSEPPAVAGFRLLGAHTDSPNLRVKPSAEASRHGYRQVGVEVYGGVLYSTWLDRDLSIAGRVLVRKDGRAEARLVDLERPIARVPSLAIHLNRGVNTEGLVLNAQKHLVPMLGLGKEVDLVGRLARALGERAEDVLGYDLCLYDTARASLGGVDDELLYAARLDNLASCQASVRALLAASGSAPQTRVIALYDHEEVGSRSAAGAAGTALRDLLRRITAARPERGSDTEQGFPRAIQGSLLVSADMAHALHPNYAEQHEPQHQPRINQGLVIKSNANQSYATDGLTAAAFALACERVGYEAQRFVVRTDLPCGSTIGPITAAELGIPTVDVGAPMLSMHSCREVAGTLDVFLALRTFAELLAAPIV